jgi:hypothetical protein
MLLRFILFLLVCAISYACYYDIRVGTLPALQINNANSEANIENEAVATMGNQTTELNYIDVTVQNGENVLSIVERINDGNVPHSIEQIIYDFELLNPGENAQVVQSGTTYQFPLYTSKQ